MTRIVTFSDPKFFLDQNFFSERYCYIFFIFGVGWGKGVKGGPLGGTKKNEKQQKKFSDPKNFSHPKFFLEMFCCIFFYFWGGLG